jgi:hypothetical protein
MERIEPARARFAHPAIQVITLRAADDFPARWSHLMKDPIQDGISISSWIIAFVTIALVVLRLFIFHS